MEIYKWLFRKNGFRVSDTGYFVYCNGNTDKEAFDGKLEFDVKIIPYAGDALWVEYTILDAIEYLKSDKLSHPGPDCYFCKYRKSAMEAASQSANQYFKEFSNKRRSSNTFSPPLKLFFKKLFQHWS